MNTISNFTKALPESTLTRALGSLKPDYVVRRKVRIKVDHKLVPLDARAAGQQFARLCLRMADTNPLSDSEKRYVPWLSSLRNAVWELGATSMTIEHPVRLGALTGSCDLVAEGPGLSLAIEVKTIRVGTIRAEPRLRDLCQLGAYCGGLSPSNGRSPLGACLAYVEFETATVTLMIFKDATKLAGIVEKLASAA